MIKGQPKNIREPSAFLVALHCRQYSRIRPGYVSACIWHVMPVMACIEFQFNTGFSPEEHIGMYGGMDWYCKGIDMYSNAICDDPNLEACTY